MRRRVDDRRTVATALITGGGRGIGLATAAALAEAGFDLAIVSLEPETEIAGSLHELRRYGRQLLYLVQDIANVDLRTSLVDAIHARLGPIDCLVNNAGVTSLRRGDLLDLSPDSFDRCVGVNLRSFLPRRLPVRWSACLRPPRPVARSSRSRPPTPTSWA
jgi:3-oxoacyl-[acyl-carrier protein] reductase